MNLLYANPNERIPYTIMTSIAVVTPGWYMRILNVPISWDTVVGNGLIRISVMTVLIDVRTKNGFCPASVRMLSTIEKMRKKSANTMTLAASVDFIVVEMRNVTHMSAVMYAIASSMEYTVANGTAPFIARSIIVAIA